MSSLARLGIVAIGRNEGQRLRRCLRSIPSGMATACVDSGSSDGSAGFARDWGAIVVELDPGRPFTAARARHEGFEALIARLPDLEYVQFVDGDCEFEGGWLEAACTALDADPALGVVCGRRRERFPDANFYNALSDREWDTPLGPAAACGGDALMRIEAYTAAGGFDPRMVAHEEPELCARIAAAGYGILRIAAPMTVHEAAATRFSQWWRRNLRAGYGYLQAQRLHRGSSGDPASGLVRRAFVWGFAIPALILVIAAIAPRIAALIAFAYPLQTLRIFLRSPGRRWFDFRAAALQTIGKFAEFAGMATYAADSLRHSSRSAPDYKQ